MVCNFSCFYFLVHRPIMYTEGTFSMAWQTRPDWFMSNDHHLLVLDHNDIPFTTTSSLTYILFRPAALFFSSYNPNKHQFFFQESTWKGRIRMFANRAQPINGNGWHLSFMLMGKFIISKYKLHNEFISLDMPISKLTFGLVYYLQTIKVISMLCILGTAHTSRVQVGKKRDFKWHRLFG